MTAEIQPRTRRPVGVWIIFIFYLLSAGWTLLSFALIFAGAINLNEAQRTYFASLSNIDWFLTLLIGVVGIAAAVSLFLLRRIAILLFSTALALNILLTAVQSFQTNWAEALGGPGLVGVLIGWVILVVILFYARGLAKKGVLVY